MLKYLRALILLLLFAPLVAQAQDGLTTAALVTRSTFESIAVVAPYTGDANANATVAVQYRETGAMTWLDAYTPMIDRRTTVGGVSNSSNVNQARVSVVGLTSNTSYDIQATWTDADGVTGTNPRTDALSTVTTTPTTGGATYYIAPAGNDTTGNGSSGTPWLTFSKAQSASVAGDTIKCKTGTYTVTTISSSGTSVAYRAFMPDTNAACVIAGDTSSASSVGTTISADYWRITAFGTGGTLTVNPSGGSSISISTGADHIYIEDINCTDVATSDHVGDTAYHACVKLPGTNTHIYILRITATTTTVPAPAGPLIDGVVYANLADSVICDNTFTGSASTRAGFWDSIGNATNSSKTNQTNNDYCRNIFSEFRDDPLEADGSGINVRIYGNTTHSTRSYTSGGAIVAISLAPIWIGPAYLFRNYARFSGTDAYYGIKYLSGNDPEMNTVFGFHNTIDTNLGAGGHETIALPKWSYFRNNIFRSGGSVINGNVTGTVDMNYNIVNKLTGNDIAKNWSGTTDYNLIADFRGCTTGCGPTGNEDNGSSADPLIDATTGVITSSSPAYNTGVVLPNFNDSTSAWPYAGAAPDIGYFEVGTVSLSSISPSFGVQGATVGVTLTGSVFNGSDAGVSTVVNVSGTGISQTSLVVASDTSITVNFVLAGGASATARNVTVTTNLGTSNAQSFTVVASGGAPTLTSISPSAGRNGTTVPVTLTGTDFNAGGGTITESCDGIAFSSIGVASATSITALATIDADQDPASICQIFVTTSSGVSNAQTFTTAVSGLAPVGRLTVRGGR